MFIVVNSSLFGAPVHYSKLGNSEQNYGQNPSFIKFKKVPFRTETEN